MKIEPLHLASPLNKDQGTKTPRLPRWTRQEILTLIQGKRVAETRLRSDRVGGSEFGSGPVEPKWSTVSSYCRKLGVNRGPVQCRKRWSNLASDFKKIKEFESRVSEESESFWFMRNDLRREKKLPGFFDKEVFDILCGGDVGGGSGSLGDEEGGINDGRGLELALGSGNMEVEPESVFDSGRNAGGDDGLFSEFDHSGQDGGGSPVREADTEAPPSRDIPPPTPISVAYQASTFDADKEFSRGFYVDLKDESNSMGTCNETEPAIDERLGSTQGGKKRKRHTPDENEEAIHWQQHLIKTLENNGKLLSSQLETQNNHFQLEREQQKDHANNLVAVLSKIADALGKIADKL